MAPNFELHILIRSKGHKATNYAMIHGRTDRKTRHIDRNAHTVPYWIQKFSSKAIFFLLPIGTGNSLSVTRKLNNYCIWRFFPVVKWDKPKPWHYPQVSVLQFFVDQTISKDLKAFFHFRLMIYNLWFVSVFYLVQGQFEYELKPH